MSKQKQNDMTQQEINQASTIVERYTKVNTLALIAKNALVDLNYELFSGLISDEEKLLIYNAMDVLDKVKRNTSFYEAIAHYDRIKNV